MKTAQEAYEATKQRNEAINSELLKMISNKIDEAISQGKYLVSIHESIPVEVIKMLTNNGYSFTSFSNPREGDIATISWNRQK